MESDQNPIFWIGRKILSKGRASGGVRGIVPIASAQVMRGDDIVTAGGRIGDTGLVSCRRGAVTAIDVT